MTLKPSKVPGEKAGPNGSFPIGDAKHARLAIAVACVLSTPPNDDDDFDDLGAA